MKTMFQFFSENSFSSKIMYKTDNFVTDHVTKLFESQFNSLSSLLKTEMEKRSDCTAWETHIFH